MRNLRLKTLLVLLLLSFAPAVAVPNIGGWWYSNSGGTVYITTNPAFTKIQVTGEHGDTKTFDGFFTSAGHLKVYGNDQWKFILMPSGKLYWTYGTGELYLHR
jgi:hypothetical protein